MKKTLLLTHEYYPYRGGVGRYCYQLFKRFPEDKYIVLTDQKINNGNPNLFTKKLTARFIRPTWIGGLIKVWKFYVENKIEIIVTPHIFPLGTICYFLNKFTRIPYVISLHGLDINLAIKRNKALTIKILNNAKHIITNSKSTKDILKPLSINKPVTVITPYLDSDKISVNELELNKIKKKYEGKKVILSVGRLVKRKGQDTMIRIMPKVVESVPNAFYIIIGSGPDDAYLKRLIVENHIFDAVEILEDITDDALSAYFTMANIFVMPSRKRGPDVEGFGIVYLNAAQFSLPIIAGISGGEPEAVGGDSCGVLLDGRDEKGLTEAVIQLLIDDEVSKYIANNSHKHLESLPNWDVQSEVLLKIIS